MSPIVCQSSAIHLVPMNPFFPAGAVGERVAELLLLFYLACCMIYFAPLLIQPLPQAGLISNS